MSAMRYFRRGQSSILCTPFRDGICHKTVAAKYKVQYTTCTSLKKSTVLVHSSVQYYFPSNYHFFTNRRTPKSMSEIVDMLKKIANHQTLLHRKCLGWMAIGKHPLLTDLLRWEIQPLYIHVVWDASRSLNKPAYTSIIKVKPV